MLESSNACHLTIFRSVEKHYPWSSTVYSLPYHAKAKTTVLHCTDYEVWLLNQFFTEIMQHLLYMYIDKYENVPYHPGITHMCYERKKTREQNTCKKKTQHMIYFWKAEGVKDFKYDIPMCQYHSSRPQPIQLVPTMQKKLFTLSFQPKFLGSQKLLHHGHFWWCSKKKFPRAKWSQGHVWAK